MTRIIETPALDYSDILIKPKLGKNLNSRSKVKLTREFRFKHGETRTGTPVMSANMFTVGNFKTAKELLKKGMFPTLHKFYTADEIVNFYTECRNENISTDNLFISIGLRDYISELRKLEDITNHFIHGEKLNICIDAPNFYIPKALEVLKETRKRFVESVIMVGNVTSSDILPALFEYADLVKIGIGPGCFHGKMQVITQDGLKQIKDISIGDKVLTHTGKYQKVCNKMIINTHQEYIKINDIECTPEHQFMVCNKEDKSKITEKNYLDYCFWISAEDLDPNKHLLLKIS